MLATFDSALVACMINCLLQCIGCPPTAVSRTPILVGTNKL